MGQFFHISWSLAIEEWFYLLFPAAIFGFGVFTRSNRWRFIAAVSLLFTASIAARLVLGPGRPWDDGIRKVVVMRMDAIMWGVMVALLEATAPNIFARLQTKQVLWLGIAITAVALIGSSPATLAVRRTSRPRGQIRSGFLGSAWVARC